MSGLNADTIEALLAAVDEAIAAYRDSHGDGPPPVEPDWLRRGRFLRPQKQHHDPQEIVDPSPWQEYWQDHLKNLYEYALDLWQPDMTELPDRNDDVYRALVNLKRWCKENLHGEKPADKGEAKSSPVRYRNEVTWNDGDLAYYPNRQAIRDAQKVGTDHEIGDLKELNADKLNKRLRSPDCEVRFMSRQKPCRGKVHKDDWDGYLREQIDAHNRFDEAVEHRARELLDE